MKEFGTPTQIYEDIDVLDPSAKTYRPNELPEREDELDTLHEYLKPVQMGGTPKDSLVYGPTGQGKTVGVELKTDQLQAWANENDVDLTVVQVSCEGANSSYQALSTTVKQLREVRKGPGEDRPRGYSKKDLLEMAFAEMENIGGTIILILDEVDAIGEDDYILYEFSRSSLDGVKLGLIGITNDLNFRRNLDEDVRSSLGKREVQFSPYNAHQLRDILARRAANALKDTYFDGGEGNENLVSDALEGGVIPLCASLAAQDTGDARQGIELLSHACDVADRKGRNSVTEEDVRSAHDRIETQAIASGIASETIQRQIALLTVINRQMRGEEWIETSNLYETYKTLCEHTDINQLAYRTFDEKLSDLKGAGVLDKMKQGRGKGSGVTNKYQLTIDAGSALAHLEESGDDRINELADIARKQG